MPTFGHSPGFWSNIRFKNGAVFICNTVGSSLSFLLLKLLASETKELFEVSSVRVLIAMEMRVPENAMEMRVPEDATEMPVVKEKKKKKPVLKEKKKKSVDKIQFSILSPEDMVILSFSITSFSFSAKILQSEFGICSSTGSC